jgi:hypothetical protein
MRTGLPRRRPDRQTEHLSRPPLRDSFVIARNTAMTFKGKPIDAKAIGIWACARFSKAQCRRAAIG